MIRSWKQRNLDSFVERAHLVEREFKKRGQWLGPGVEDGLALLHAPDDIHFERLMSERKNSPDHVDQAADFVLRRDLYRFSQFWLPDEEHLKDARVLHVFGTLIHPFESYYFLTLAGPVFDNKGNQISQRRYTSFLVAADAREGKWVRTWNRFYRTEWPEWTGREPPIHGDPRFSDRTENDHEY